MDGIPCQVVESELDLINTVIDMVKMWDPDVLAGWELHNSSWGWVSSRADQAFGMGPLHDPPLMIGIDFTEQLSRVVGGRTGPKKDFYSATHSSTFKVSGRHILNIWRICRSEFNLTQYTFENVVFHVLHQRSVNELARGDMSKKADEQYTPFLLGESDRFMEEQDFGAYPPCTQILLPASSYVCRAH